METEHGHRILENNAIFDDILTLAFSSDGNKIAAINQNEVITIWDVFTCQVLARFIDPARISLQRSGLILFSGANAIGVNTIGRNSYRSRVRYAGYPKLVFSPNHRQIALFSGNTAIRLWDFRSGFLLWKGGDTDFGLRADTNPGPKLQAHTLPAISPDWSRCVTVMKDVLYLRDVSTGTLMRQLKRHTEDVFQVIFSPNSSLLASASGNDIVIWDAKNGDLLRMLGAGLERPISSIVFWPDSRRLMSISSNRVLQLWDAQTGMMVTAFEGHTGRRTVT
ncbi:WD40-repeat-containing domain protein [Hypomontagnella monticulosa]|nr:WD40-repeat-containing domain protein [Hypomontagnella monticulosa]